MTPLDVTGKIGDHIHPQYLRNYHGTKCKKINYASLTTNDFDGIKMACQNMAELFDIYSSFIHDSFIQFIIVT